MVSEMKQLLFRVKSYSNPINIGLLIVRVFTSGMMLTHGWPKFLRLLNGNLKFGDPIGIGSDISFILVVFAEFFCSILIIIGLGTRLATIPLVITMFVALFIAHGSDPIFDHTNILAYIVTYILLFFTGSGKFSLEYKLFRK